MNGNKEINDVFDDITSFTLLTNKFIYRQYPKESLISLINKLYNVSIETANNLKKEEVHYQQQQQLHFFQQQQQSYQNFINNNQKKKKKLKILRCNKCLLKGHKEENCSVDVSKFCDQCKIKGHNITECIRCTICRNKGHKGINCTFSESHDQNGNIKDNIKPCHICDLYHNGDCLIICHKCNQHGHRTKYCKTI